MSSPTVAAAVHARLSDTATALEYETAELLDTAADAAVIAEARAELGRYWRAGEAALAELVDAEVARLLHHACTR